MSTLKLDKITGRLGVGGDVSPITLSGDTATLGSGVTNNAGVASGTIGSGATFPAGHVVQVVRSSNDLAVNNGVTGTSFVQSNNLPYVDITPKQANSQYYMAAYVYGGWGYSIPALGFCVSTDGGSNYTFNLGGDADATGATWSYGSFMTWGALGDNGGEFTIHYSDFYKSSFAAGASNIRFAIAYRNVYHNSLANSFSISSPNDNACRLIIFEIAV